MTRHINDDIEALANQIRSEIREVVTDCGNYPDRIHSVHMEFYYRQAIRLVTEKLTKELVPADDMDKWNRLYGKILRDVDNR